MNSPFAASIASRLQPPVSAITAYDYPSARFCDEAGVQMILVGDSLGMVVAGNPDTTTVTLEQMIYHTEMVRRGVKNAVLVSDFPINTYRNPAESVANGQRLVDAGADAVKLEGLTEQLPNVEALVSSGIPVCAHVGMLPQRVVEEGGYKKKGKTDAEARSLVDASMALERAGAFAIVLESVVAEVAAEISRRLTIPTIGIGSGTECDGQIRVLHDVTGGYPWFVPPFARVYGNVAEVTRSSLLAYIGEVNDGSGRIGKGH